MQERLRSWWREIRKPLWIIGFFTVSIGVVVLIFVVVRLYGTGFTGKTLWDWLQLLGGLAIPIVVGFGTAFFTRQQAKTSEANAETQQQEELLRTYFDKISDLLLDKELSTNPSIQSIVRARTLAVLHILYTKRKSIVLRFLHDSNSLQYVKDLLYSLDLSNTDLYRIDLSKANLRGSDLSGANLRFANLREANLHYAILIKADLLEVELTGAKLRGADLDGANLKDTFGITVEELEKQAKSLKGTIMPDGSKHD